MIIFIIFLFLTNCNAKGRYECGPHGNFEYCIEGFPGCVVGCHCFPGYYFDTDTKICEPNMKLTQDFRRHYAVGTQPPSGDSEASTEPPPPTTAHALEAHVDEIAKDTGDLSDWLYNQFFKTIENQVINKTDDDELLKETRRSGGGKKRNKNKRKKSFKKSTKRGLRRKLLRISEDDSMFDSSSSESGSRSRESSGTWESWEENMGGERGHGGDPNKDHGHRKIVVYSKQPKAPLPSFIFLPNVETPFYPPIGLPVPPMPMYPMIPIPPIQPIIGPPPVINNCTESDITPTTQGPTTTRPGTTAVASTTEEGSKTTAPAHDTDKPASDATTAPEGPTLPTIRKHLRNQSRKKLLQRLKNRNNKQQMIKRMGTMGRMLGKQENNHFIDTPQDPSVFASDNFFQQPIEEEIHDQEKDDLHPYDDDVDFKYLTQLIHRVDANQTQSMSTISINPSKPGSGKDIKPFGMYRKLHRPPLTPGLLHAELPTRRRFSDCSKPDDNYYSNLGRQIATLIRGIHPDVVGEVDIDIAQTHNSKTEPFLSENSFAPRSYWERFVRSPLRKDLGHFSKYEDLRVSNEQLFDLENEAVVAASSRPILTLQELENVISAMNNVQKRAQSRQFKQDHYKPSKVSLNVSLLPRDRSRPTEVPKKLERENLSDNTFSVETRVSDKKGVSSRDSRRNKPITSNANADKMLSNVTKNYELFKEHKVTDELLFNVPRNQLRFIATVTSTQMTLKPHIKSPGSPKPKHRPNPIKFNRSKVKKVNGFYFDDINIASKLRTEPKKPNAFYLKSKPASYFFNEFDFFVKK